MPVTITLIIGTTQKPSLAHHHWQLVSYFDFKSHLCLALFYDLWLKPSFIVTPFLTVVWLCSFWLAFPAFQLGRHSRDLLSHPFWSLSGRTLGSLQQRSVLRWPPGLLEGFVSSRVPEGSWCPGVFVLGFLIWKFPFSLLPPPGQRCQLHWKACWGSRVFCLFCFGIFRSLYLW